DKPENGSSDRSNQYLQFCDNSQPKRAFLAPTQPPPEGRGGSRGGQASRRALKPTAALTRGSWISNRNIYLRRPGSSASCIVKRRLPPVPGKGVPPMYSLNRPSRKIEGAPSRALVGGYVCPCPEACSSAPPGVLGSGSKL